MMDDSSRLITNMTVCAIIHLLVFNNDSCATEDGVVCQVVKGSELLGGHN